MTTTRIYKGFQTVVPSDIRKKIDLKQNDKLDWGIDSNGDIKIKVKKEKTLDDLSGLISLPYETDAVELKKKSQRGEL
ncbi:MAG: AbrB/MazE/SpoVT family DNA-binding domain-containing protein [Methanobacteriaceae archaeon]|jgi:bifunctional DNA-binding transcriptional regulator/antitoxin component of YhaV-PrlF toxin-antitoxin module|nr:AbrB/MazE/SpoVT family DNA-binding domain-containing protein [Methanobacteriaceae archaeon]